MVLLAIVLLVVLGIRLSTRINWNPSRSIGQPMDSLDGVAVYYNGAVNQSHGRNTAPDGYNIGIKYQCVEFVKRYYLQHYHHKMPDAYGHAKDFFDPAAKDGGMNKARGLMQFRNGSSKPPQKGDLLVWGPSDWNAYGHVAIVKQVRGGKPDFPPYTVEYIQQNPGPFGEAVAQVGYHHDDQGFHLEDERILGWLRMPE
jgi:hypothetical protein